METFNEDKNIKVTKIKLPEFISGIFSAAEESVIKVAQLPDIPTIKRRINVSWVESGMPGPGYLVALEALRIRWIIAREQIF